MKYTVYALTQNKILNVVFYVPGMEFKGNLFLSCLLLCDSVTMWQKP